LVKAGSNAIEELEENKKNISIILSLTDILLNEVFNLNEKVESEANKAIEFEKKSLAY